MSDIDWKKKAAITVSVAGIVLGVWIFCKTLLALFLPFVLAFSLAVLTRPFVLRFHRRTGCPLRISAVLVTLLALVLLLLILGIICNRLLVEARNLLNFLINDLAGEGGEVSRVISFFEELWQRLPLLSQLRESGILQEVLGDPEVYVTERLREFLSGLAGGMATAFGEVLRRLPGVLFFLLVSVISCFYFAVEYDAVLRAVHRLLPARLSVRLPEWRKRAAGAARRYLRAYALLFLLTLAELSVGFLILRISYPFLLAFLIAFLDILPVLGVGTVVLPWALFMLATGRAFVGVGLLVLYLIITVVRQIVEPHLVGKSLGLHPILMLISVYVGLRLFGFGGIILGPAVALLIKGALEQGGRTRQTAEENSAEPQ